MNYVQGIKSALARVVAPAEPWPNGDRRWKKVNSDAKLVDAHAVGNGTGGVPRQSFRAFNPRRGLQVKICASAASGNIKPSPLGQSKSAYAGLF